MSIALEQKVKALEERIAQLEALVRELTAPKVIPEERPNGRAQKR